MNTSTIADTASPRLDSHLLRFSQGCVVVLTALAFLFSQPLLVAVAALCLTLSALVPNAGPFRFLYKGVVVPLHLLQPKFVEDDPAPHRFAQGIGAIFLLAATILLFLTSAHTAGWVLDLIVFVLATSKFQCGLLRWLFRVLSSRTPGTAPTRALRR